MSKDMAEGIRLRRTATRLLKTGLATVRGVSACSNRTTPSNISRGLKYRSFRP